MIRPRNNSSPSSTTPPAIVYPRNKGYGVAMYGRIASTLRHRIARGDWKMGDQLPTVEALASELDVGKVTVRQAYALLAAEGLVESRRGRGTHVRGVPPSQSEHMRTAINSDNVDSSQMQIHVLEVKRDMKLPLSANMTGDSDAAYVRLRKLHAHRDLPFCYGEMFVLQSVFDRFPKDAHRHSKINRLIRDVVPAKVDMLRQRITVEPASEVIARLLSYDVAAPLAVVHRILRSRRGEILSVGEFFYRSDQFVLESEVPAALTEMYPSLSVPERRPTALATRVRVSKKNRDAPEPAGSNTGRSRKASF